VPGYVLVVDDDPSVLDAVALVLCVKGIRCRTAPTGLKALEVIDCERPALMLLDVNMPELDGPGVLCALKASGLCFPTVLMSGNTPQLERTARELGVAGSLEKPFGLVQVLTLLDRLLLASP